jgi:hypothetical protein
MTAVFHVREEPKHVSSVCFVVKPKKAHDPEVDVLKLYFEINFILRHGALDEMKHE